jgi:hypothetical protein
MKPESSPKNPATRSKPDPKKRKTGLKAGFMIDGGEG